MQNGYPSLILLFEAGSLMNSYENRKRKNNKKICCRCVAAIHKEKYEKHTRNIIKEGKRNENLLLRTICEISTFRQLCNSFASSMTVSSPYYAYMEGHPLAYINFHTFISIGKDFKRVRNFWNIFP